MAPEQSQSQSPSQSQNMAAAGAVCRVESLPSDGFAPPNRSTLRSVISDLASLDLSFLTTFRQNSESAPEAHADLPDDVTPKEHHDHSGYEHERPKPEASQKELAPKSALAQSAPAPASAGGAPAKDPVTCQVACLSWPGQKDGFRKSNQDSYCFMRTTDKKSLLFGVFDGHGPRGRDASQLVKQRLPELLMGQGDALNLDTQDTFVKCFNQMQEDIVAQGSFDCAVSGTTAVMAHLHQRHLTVAWAGDSRAVLASEGPSGDLVASDLSEDHKPEREGERARIEASNGSVYRDVNEMGEDVGPYRVWGKKGPMLGLAMSRSLGDRLAHNVGVSASPDVKTVVLNPQDRFMILASDGVWEFVSSEEAIKIVQSCPTSNEGAKKLMQQAKARWLAYDVGSYVDDITALVVAFSHNA